MGIISCYLMFRWSKSRQYISPFQLNFCELLKLTRHFRCQDDRGQVYGLLGLPTADDISRTLISDYKKPIEEIYYLVAKKIIDSSASLTVLSSVQWDHDHVWLTKNHSADKGRFSITTPSWVPQWNVLLTRSVALPHGIRFAASLDTHLQRQHTDDPLKLKLRGILYDSLVNYAYSGRDFVCEVVDGLGRVDLGDFGAEDQIQKISGTLKPAKNILKGFLSRSIIARTGMDFLYRMSYRLRNKRYTLLGSDK
jgi:hypothetical protein